MNGHREVSHKGIAAPTLSCEHEYGTRIQEFDADGCGYYVWMCDNCEYTEIDDMP